MPSRHITQCEYKLSNDATLLSTTDLSGHILYANAKFVEVSGYDFGELEHQPHSMVRHQDMPSEAFADMWKTLKSGQAWTSLVKNRRKNGDYYWVRANAAPMIRNGQATGYLSVRTKPDSHEINSAEILYRRFKAGKASGLKFHKGLIVRTGIMGWASSLQLMSVGSRIRWPLFLGAGALIAGLPAVGVTEAVPFALAAGAVVGVFGLANWFIQSQITKPLGQIAVAAQKVATGEVGASLGLNRCDVIGMIARSVNQSGLNLQSLVSDVLAQSSGVQLTSLQIAHNSIG